MTLLTIPTAQTKKIWHQPVQAFNSIPALAEWKKASCVGSPLGLPKRSDDPALTQIDALVGELAGMNESGSRTYFLGELFFATLWWLNHHKTDARMHPERRPAILRLNLCAANKLADTFQCALSSLSIELQKIYGVAMCEHGIQTDGPAGVRGRYLSIKEREKYRIIFRHGLAHSFPEALIGTGEGVTSRTKLDLADTQGHSETMGMYVREGYGFVMGLDGELFVGRFGPRAEHVGYHSSFLRGRPTLCAGSIVIEQGRITQICNDSGHYKPIDTAMAKMLARLQAAGVYLRGIKVVPVDPTKPDSTGDLFLAANGNWETVQKSGRIQQRGQVLH